MDYQLASKNSLFSNKKCLRTGGTCDVYTTDSPFSVLLNAEHGKAQKRSSVPAQGITNFLDTWRGNIQLSFSLLTSLCRNGAVETCSMDSWILVRPWWSKAVQAAASLAAALLEQLNRGFGGASCTISSLCSHFSCQLSALRSSLGPHLHEQPLRLKSPIVASKAVMKMHVQSPTVASKLREEPCSEPDCGLKGRDEPCSEPDSGFKGRDEGLCRDVELPRSCTRWRSRDRSSSLVDSPVSLSVDPRSSSDGLVRDLWPRALLSRKDAVRTNSSASYGSCCSDGLLAILHSLLRQQ